MRICGDGAVWVSTSFGIVDTTFLHICSDPAVRTPFGVYLVCVPSTLVSDRLYRSSYLPYQILGCHFKFWLARRPYIRLRVPTPTISFRMDFVFCWAPAMPLAL
jgi:hypothetical protein